MLRILVVIAALCLLLLMTTPLRAATCEANMSDIDFGAVSLRSGEVNRTSGTLTVTCAGLLNETVGVCLRFGAGSGGAGPGNAPRFMSGPTGQSLAYQLRLGGHGAVHGTLNEVYLPVAVVSSAGQVTIPIYAELLANGTEFVTGAYQSTFSGLPHIEMSYGIVSCELFGQSHPVSDFAVSAQTVASCELDVGSLDFGQISNLAAPADATAAVDIRCTSGTGYSVSMGLGDGPGVSDPALRRMQGALGTLAYGLYRDPARSLVWGEAANQRNSATGTGYGQRFTVYGRIHAGQQAPAGSYGDSVVVTVHY
ncbi:spore coat U domain-containing protein [Marinovum sp.]|uniref:Csu type fimbrial protein n=1 Tax=Marinovum sp. TaxID=2024839 RepID=UPI002B2724F3|nr:spore coat U domain-containing protein [Marinovum sp.]